MYGEQVLTIVVTERTETSVHWKFKKIYTNPAYRHSYFCKQKWSAPRTVLMKHSFPDIKMGEQLKHKKASLREWPNHIHVHFTVTHVQILPSTLFEGLSFHPSSYLNCLTISPCQLFALQSSRDNWDQHPTP